MTIDSFIRRYWKYYLDLEKSVLSTEHYVEHDKGNQSTFSIEYLRLIQLICSEIDVVAKTIVATVNTALKPSKIERMTISNWGYELQQWRPMIESKAVIYKGHTYTPWQSWLYEKRINRHGNAIIALAPKKQTPEWWTAYNKIKHLRVSAADEEMKNFRKATQLHVYKALTALYILESEFAIECFGEEALMILRDSALFHEGEGIGS